MNSELKILVVDDESVVCESCSRIFRKQGYQVETSTDPQEGLQKALAAEYDAIFLDMKMPVLDGVGFLKRLRREESERNGSQSPVIIITGYSDKPAENTARNLGISDYIYKPFKPEEIKGALARSVRPETKEAPTVEAAPELPKASSPTEVVHFFRETWVRAENEERFLVGSLLREDLRKKTVNVRLAQLNEIVLQGLPIAELELSDGSTHCIPSPVTGEVIEQNCLLNRGGEALWQLPWSGESMLVIRPLSADPDLSNCSERTVIIVSSCAERITQETEQFESFGCTVFHASSSEEAVHLSQRLNPTLTLVDATSFGASTEDIVRKQKEMCPSDKLVVIVSENDNIETTMRRQQIFYFAAAPLAEMEIVEMLEAASEVEAQKTKPAVLSSPIPTCINKLRITTQEGINVSLIIKDSLLQRHVGLAPVLIDRLLRSNFPLEVYHGRAGELVDEVLKESAHADRIILLEAENLGRIPGSLTSEEASDWETVLGNPDVSIERITLQPRDAVSEEFSFERKISEAIASHVFSKMITSVTAG